MNGRICFVCFFAFLSKQNKFVRWLFWRINGAPILLFVSSDLQCPRRLTLNLGFSGKEQVLLLTKICEKKVSYRPYWSLQGRSRTSSSARLSCINAWPQCGNNAAKNFLNRICYLFFNFTTFFNFQYCTKKLLLKSIWYKTWSKVSH